MVITTPVPAGGRVSGFSKGIQEKIGCGKGSLSVCSYCDESSGKEGAIMSSRAEDSWTSGSFLEFEGQSQLLGRNMRFSLVSFLREGVRVGVQLSPEH